jgi:hypothetical protein
MHSKYIITYECHDKAQWMWKVVQLEKYFDFSLYSHHFSLLSLTSLLSAPEREVTSPSDFKVVGALVWEQEPKVDREKIVPWYYRGFDWWHAIILQSLVHVICCFQLLQSVPITTDFVSTNPAHVEMYSIQQHCAIKLVIDLRQVSGFSGNSSFLHQ